MNSVYAHAFVDELEKIAIFGRKKRPDPWDGTEAEKNFLTKGKVKELQKTLGTDVDVRTGKTPGHFVPALNGKYKRSRKGLDRAGIPYSDTRHTASAREGSSVIAHELGHAKNREGKILGKLQRARSAGNFASLAANLAAPHVTNPKLRKAMPYIAAAGQAPTLIDEGAASLRGRGALKRTGAPKAVRKAYRKKVVKGFSSYAKGAVVATATTKFNSLTQAEKEQAARAVKDKAGKAASKATAAAKFIARKIRR